MNPYKTGPRQALYFCFRIWVRVRILALAHQLQMLGWGVVRMVIGREVLSPLPLCPPHFLHGPTTPGVKAAISGEKPATDGLIYRIANLFVYSRQYRNTRTYKHSLSCVWTSYFIFQAVHDINPFSHALTANRRKFIDQIKSFQLLEKDSVKAVSHGIHKTSFAVSVNCVFPNTHNSGILILVLYRYEI